MQKLISALEKLNISYTETMISQFRQYMEETLIWNEKINLTAITEREDFIIKHFIDSVLAADAQEVKEAENIIDVGTGAGFPGVPLAILFPQKQFVLMDSVNKRLKVIDDICAKTKIRNVTTVHSRAEELAQSKQHREKYDLCVSRAVANMATLSEYCLPFIRLGGYFLAYKGPDYEEELTKARTAIQVLGGRVESVRERALSDLGLHHKIIYIRKERQTPAKYPRKAGIPSKEPLK